MKLNTFQSIVFVFFSTSNIRAAVHRTSAEVWTTPYHRTVSSNSWYAGLALEKDHKNYFNDQLQHSKQKEKRTELPELYKRCLQTVQRCMGQRQGCHDILQETHEQLAILFLSRDHKQSISGLNAK